MMSPPHDAPKLQPPLPVWWGVWTSALALLCVMWWQFGFFKLTGHEPSPNPFVDLVGLVPLFVGIVVRWLVLPRYTDAAKAFPMFVVGVSLGEACGILGIFRGGPYADDLFLLGVLGIVQFMPFFTRRFGAPRGSGFIPNN